ncbi:MAG: LCP family protein [Anaerolineae bacterium]|nr:LCP family protein [Anaerolineae bacterium]
MKNIYRCFGLLILLSSLTACSLPENSESLPIVFPTMRVLFPSRTPVNANSAGGPTFTPTPSPTMTPWPLPFFGTPGYTPSTPIPTPFTPLGSPNDINILLIGSDRRTSASFRTDVLIIVNIQPDHDLVTMISIPRDLYVYIPGWQMQRINTAYQHGESSAFPGSGIDLLKGTILYNLGIKIDHTALVDFDGFREIVDTLGGIDIPLACPYTDWHVIDPDKDLEDEDNWKLYTVGPGVTHMDGDLALWYARSRQRSNDFDRGRRQQEVLRAIYSQAVTLNIIKHIPELFTELRDAVTTDIGLNDLISLGKISSNLGSARIRSYYINTDVVQGWTTATGASVLIPDGPALRALIQEALSPPDQVEQTHLAIVVEVWNGTYHGSWDVLAADRLHYGGFETIIQPADNRDYHVTLLYDFTKEQDKDQSTALLELLGLPPSSLVSSPDPDSDVSYRLIVARDYQVCFDPSKIER